MNVLSDNTKRHDLTGIEFEAALHRILGYWSDVVFDHANVRFFSKVDHANRVYHTAPLGSVMYARILWAFSAGYLHTPTSRYMAMADIAYRYIRQHFIDPDY